MRSVADIPPGDDADDELSGISPELVLVDPELARLVRDREPPLGAPALPRPRRASTLRLVPAPAAEPAIVPRPAPGGPPAAAERKSGPVVDAEPVASPPAQSPPPAGAGAPPAATTGAELSERIVDAEPARAVASLRPEIPPPLAEPARRSTATALPERARSAPHALGSTAEPVMPHPVKRTSAAPRPVRASRPARKGRRVLALLGGIAVASAAVLGLLQLTGGPSETSQTVAGPQAKSPAPRARQPASKPKPKPKPKPAVRTAPSPARPSASATKKPSPTPKPKARATPKAAAGVSPKPTTSAEPKAPAAPKTRTATQPRTPPAAPRPTPKTAKAVPATAPGAPPAARRFAWAPVEGAIGYHVELFRGAERVLVRETKEPVLELGPTWRYQGRTVTLTPGAYRWYVWPVTKSGRATQAVVQAKLTV